MRRKSRVQLKQKRKKYESQLDITHISQNISSIKEEDRPEDVIVERRLL